MNNKNDRNTNVENNINLLVLGASGAGKSSFIKTFMLHPNHIESTNDGQTTRANVIYDLNLFTHAPSAEICFLKRDDFVTRMKHLNYTKYLIKIVNLLHKDSDYFDLQEYLLNESLQNRIDDATEIKENLSDFETEIIKMLSGEKPSADVIGERRSSLMNLKEQISKTKERIVRKEKETTNLIEALKLKDDSSLENIYEKRKEILDSIENHLQNVECRGSDANKKKVNTFLNNNWYELIEVLSKVEGFFDIAEFKKYLQDFGVDFISLGNEFEKLNKPIVYSEDNRFEHFFESYYEAAYDIIVDLLKKVGITLQGKYKVIMALDDRNQVNKVLTYCLQAKEGKSLTGIVDYVYIRDSISNDYSFIIDDLEIDSLKLIDTNGLDHADWNIDADSILADMLYSLQQRRLIYFNSNLAVLYVKKLDAGRPTELKDVIPRLFRMIPQAPIYCVFNGLDIYLGSRISYFSGFDMDNTKQNKPKSIEYLIGDAFKDDIKRCKVNQNLFIDHLCDTLRKNIVVMSSDMSTINNYFNIEENNRNEIRKLLLSINLKEYSSMNILSQKIIDNIQSGSYDVSIDSFIFKFFERSSKTDWANAHWKTREANYSRLRQGYKRNSLGYWGTYRHLWNQLFHQGYVDLVIQEESNFLRIQDCNEADVYSVDACIKNMEEDFLGEAYQLAYRSESDIETKSGFRQILETMYQRAVEANIYPSSPLEDKEIEEKDITQIDYLNKVSNFAAGYKLVKDELVQHFKQCLVDTIKKERNAKLKNILRINYDLYSQLDKLKYVFEKKYPNIKFEDLFCLWNWKKENDNTL